MSLDRKTKENLLEQANKAKKNAYVPYSNFPVGAALLTKEGKVYTGCNIENASYGASNCAERTTFFKAISEGEKNFIAMAIVSDHPGFTFPCGICRQVIQEFSKDLPIVLQNAQGEIKTLSIKELLPYPFTEEDLTITKEAKINER